MQLYTPFPSVFGDLVIPDTIDTEPNAGIQQLVGRSAGSRHVLARGIAVREPRIGITCLDLRHLGASGLSIVDGLTLTTPSKIQFQKRAFGGTFDTAGHVTLVATRGKLIPEGISATQDAAEPAQLTLTFHPLFDGTNDPLQVVTQALQGTPDVPAMYRLGPVLVNGTQLTGVQSVRVQFGINFQPVRSDGEIVARNGRLGDLDPSLTIEVKNLAILQELLGVGAVPATVVVFFQKVGADYAAAVHTAIGCSGTLEVGTIAARRGDDVQPGLIARPVGPLTLNTATAITV
jgi:hypothetical protein